MKDIHITDLETYVACRRLWNWSSMLRRGLQKATISPPLFIGQGVHRGLDAYYKNDSTLSAALGEIARWTKRRTEMVIEHTGALWDSERKMIRDAYRLMTGMVLHYDMWAPGIDSNYDVLSTETHYEVPIRNPDGHPDEPTGLQLVGRYDGILQSRSTGQRYVMELKTTRNIANVSWIYRSIQGTAYTWSARQLYPSVTGIAYRMLHKKIPAAPRKLKKGGFSVAKNQATSYVYFGRCLDKLAEKAFNASIDGVENTTGIVMPLDIINSVVDAQAFVRSQYRRFLELLRARGNTFFEEKILRKQQYQFDNLERVLYYIGSQMVDPDIPIFPTSSWFHCNRCDFKDPCNLMDAEGDYEGLLEAEYAPRTYWEGKNE